MSTPEGPSPIPEELRSLGRNAAGDEVRVVRSLAGEEVQRVYRSSLPATLTPNSDRTGRVLKEQRDREGGRAPRYVVQDASSVLMFLWQRSGLTVRDVATRVNENTDDKVSPSVLSRLFRGDAMYSWPLVQQVAMVMGSTMTEMELLRDSYQAQRARQSLSFRRGQRGSEPDPIECSSTEELIEKLNDVHIWAGEPSLRQLATASGGQLRRSTLSDMLTGSRLPKESLLVSFLEICGITDVATWKVTWRRLRVKERRDRRQAKALSEMRDELLFAPVSQGSISGTVNRPSSPTP